MEGGEVVNKQKRVALAFIPILMMILAVAFAGCASTPTVGETAPAGPSAASTPRTSGPPPTPPRPQEARVEPRPVPTERDVTPSGPMPGGAVSPLKDVFFDYDRAALTDEAKRALNQNATWLKANAQARLTVEGHCDERGTAEYNLGLGDRRAKAVREYLVAAGIDGSRIRTISYGKERPFNPAHDESAWRENRRGHFVVNR